MTEDPKYYHCQIETDMSMYDHLPYHINPELCDGTHITFHSGNVIKGYFVNYNFTDKHLIIPNEDIGNKTSKTSSSAKANANTETNSNNIESSTEDFFDDNEDSTQKLTAEVDSYYEDEFNDDEELYIGEED